LDLGHLDIEEPNCPLCQNSDCRVVYEHLEPYKVVQCCACRFHYLSPRLPETMMTQFYQESIYFDGGSVGYENYLEQEHSLRATFRRFLSTLQENKLIGGSLLEVGCGYGFLLEEAKAFFNVRVGIELSSKAANLARRTADYVYEGGIDQIPAHEKFDCIMAIHVIEHAYHPRVFLAHLCKHLKAGGKMVMATPDFGSIWRRLMGRHWPSFKIPEHVLFFDKESMSALMNHMGLQDIGFLPYPHAFPLSLVARKLSIPLPTSLSKVTVWLPGTTLAMFGRWSHG
jgi:2-polyprenyl-3-methyl-5-hydroxy-6-metoxy-1,4-benzoquinol methylase